MHKRAFVRGWHEQATKLARGQVLRDGTPVKTEAELFTELDSRLKAQSRSITQPELPECAVAAYADQIAAVARVDPPQMARERRNFVLRWHAEHAGARAARRET